MEHDTTEGSEEGRSGLANWPRPLAFVLSGGGAFGSVQVGMLRALRDGGVQPDLIVGASVGSLHGALVATGRPDAVEVLDDLWRGMTRRQLFGGPVTVARSLVRSRSLSSFDRLGGLIDLHLRATRFDELAIPFAAVATDALNGEPELLRSGSIKPAVLASSAIPGVFPPVDIDGRHYVDGGVAANVPIRQAIAFGARSVICLDATPPAAASQLPGSLSGRLLHSASLMLRNQRSHAVEDLASRYRIAVLPNSIPPDMGSFNFGHNDALLDDSHRMAAAAIAAWSDPAESAVSANDDRGR
ncbi:MAG: patatin-like phospholipase family protein [Actinomycetota bacterium]